MKPSTLLVALCITILLAISSTDALWAEGVGKRATSGLKKVFGTKSSKYDQRIEAAKDRLGKYKRAKDEATKAKQRDVDLIKTGLKCLSKYALGDFCSSCDRSNHPALAHKCIKWQVGIRKVCFKNRPVNFKQLFQQRCPNRTPSPVVGAV